MGRFQAYFGFNRRELKGIAVLILLILTVWVFPYVYEYGNRYEPVLKQVEVDQSKGGKPDFNQHLDDTEQIIEPVYVEFDPNVLPAAGWQKLGLQEKQIQTISNYLAKGGRFYKKEDLQKIYGLKSADYQRLADYIVINEPKVKLAPKELKGNPKDQYTQYPKAKSVVSTTVLDLNRADSSALLILSGIGPAFASRITKYRALLGGFYQTEQLLEIYGMDSVRYLGILPHIHVSEAIVPIEINKASFEELNAHPYISAKVANLLVQYRNQHGKYNKLADLLNIVLIDHNFLQKISPYLTINDD